jgi:hypothetical protein
VNTLGEATGMLIARIYSVQHRMRLRGALEPRVFVQNCFCLFHRGACPGENFQSIDLGVTPEKVEMEVCALTCKSRGALLKIEKEQEYSIQTSCSWKSHETGTRSSMVSLLLLQ